MKYYKWLVTYSKMGLLAQLLPQMLSKYRAYLYGPYMYPIPVGVISERSACVELSPDILEP